MNQETHDTHEADQQQISQAIQTAAAQKAARTPGLAGRAAERAAGSVPAAPREFLRAALGERLALWAQLPGTQLPWGQDPDQLALPRASREIEALQGAIRALGAKKCERAAEARKFLAKTRDRIQKSLDAFRSVGADLSGPAAVAMIAKITAARDARAQAEHAVEHATRATIAAARAGLDIAEADGREIDREIAAMAESLIPPPLRDVAADLERARSETAELEAMQPESVRALQHAINSGFNAPRQIARLYVIFETDHPLSVWRARAIAESAQPT